MSEDGHIVTNFSLIDGASYAKIIDWEKRVHIVNTCHGMNKNRDLVILKIENSVVINKLKIGNSDELKVSQSIFFMNNLELLENSISFGQVSNVMDSSRDVYVGNDIEILIDTGYISKGSPIFNLHGEVVAVVYEFSQNNQNQVLAIPINELKLINTNIIYTFDDLKFIGSIIYENSRYDGQIRNGLPHGYGQMEYIFEGKEFVSWFSDLAEITDDVGHDIYIGNWINGMKEGNGFYIWHNGVMYEGEFKNGFISGNGSLVWPDGSFYKGEFLNGKFHGSGFLYDVNSKKIYIGEFRDNLKNGRFEVFHEDGTFIHERIFIDNLFYKQSS